MTHVMITDRDDIARQSLAEALRTRDYRVTSTARPGEAMSRLLDEQLDVLILGMEPDDMGGLRLLRMLQTTGAVPVVAAVRGNNEPLMARCLLSGADDVVAKPFSPELVHARLTALLRRLDGAAGTEVIRVGGLSVDPRSHTATLEGSELELRPMEFRLLAYLAEHANRVVSKDELRSELWDHTYPVTSKTVDVHLCWLRRRLGESASRPRYLRSVRGVGVKLCAPAA
ncbi:DNA-binding response regulator [Streptomyces spinoverrucosus]|uniref:DNA-binding response regulator n=1 Tax=Streptomyces spinoverrucosus TaxID=284043 RepID=A0A4Y3VWI9_9ACTN|nr:response regulator transcription factor [Streptomyces spinoverrucosus]GEC10495.1 DNA-binding response regulator [Streptomyces spinoverrucosus]GHB96220.1 DNA-binding response regulator [Streptomyces spinoverrucosus]